METDLRAHYGLLLGLTPPWRVERVELELECSRVDIWVQYPKQEPAFCPQCGQQGDLYDYREERTWRHLDTMQFETRIHCRTPRCRCAQDGIKTMKTPWAGAHSRFTLLFEAFAIEVLQACSSVSKAASILRLDWHSVNQIQRRAVQRGLARREAGEMPHIGLDEKNFGRRQVATVLTDMEKGRVWELVEGCDSAAAKAALQSVPEATREDILAACIDMSAAYRKALREDLPGADIVHDRFHVSKLLGEAVDQVRRAEAKRPPEAEAPSLKHTRYLWLRNQDNLSPQQKERFKELKNSELKVAKAWALKEAFRHFWSYRSLGWARRFFEQWQDWARSLRLTSVTRVAKTLERHFDGLYNYIFHRITNAAAEGFNSAIQSILSNARGFRRFETFRIAILFRLGKLEMFPQ